MKFVGKKVMEWDVGAGPQRDDWKEWRGDAFSFISVGFLGFLRGRGTVAKCVAICRKRNGYCNDR